MRRLVTGVSLCLSIACSSCSTDQTAQMQESLKSIDQLEQEVFTEKGKIRQDKALELISQYDAFIKRFPDQEDIPIMLLESADIAMHINQTEQALEHLNYIQDHFPEFEKMDVCIFLCAHLYEDKIGNLEMAKICYEQILSTYPNSPFADDAAGAIDNLGLSPEEILKKFKMNRASNPNESN